MMTSYQNLVISVLLLAWTLKYSESKAGVNEGEYEKSFITYVPIRHRHHKPGFYLSLSHLSPGDIHHRPHTIHPISRNHYDAQHGSTTTARNPSSVPYYPEWNSYLPYKTIINVNDNTYRDDLSSIPYRYKPQDSFLTRMNKVYSCPN